MATYSTTIRLLWVISKANLKEVQPKKCLSTKKLKCGIPNLHYYLQFYPNSDESDSGVWIFLTLCNSKKAGSSKVKFTVRIRSASISENSNHQTLTNGESYGIPLCEREDFFDANKKFFKNKKITIEFEAKITFEEPPNPVNFKDYVANFLWESDDKDLVLVVEDKELKVHKVILKSNSDVFKAMLNSNTKEAQENRCLIVDFSYECVDLFIKLLYKQKCMCEIDDDEDLATELLRFADKYHIEYLQNLVEVFFIPKISTDNVIQLANIAATSNADQLQEYCVCHLHFAIENQNSIKDFEELNEKVAAEVAKRLISPYLETL